MKEFTQIDFMEHKYYLFGILNAFANRLQAAGDTFFEEISWKQWFVLAAMELGMSMREEPLTINEIADIIGSSHQNVKQLLLKLEKAGMVVLEVDEKDRRKIRAKVTDKKAEFDKKYEENSTKFMEQLYQGLEEEEITITMKALMTMEQNLKNINGGK